MTIKRSRAILFAVRARMRAAAVIAVAAVTVAIVPRAAHAGVISGTVHETADVPYTTLSGSPFLVWYKQLSYQGFNSLAPAGSTLTSVVIAVTTYLKGSVTMDNTGNMVQIFDLNVSNQANFGNSTLGFNGSVDLSVDPTYDVNPHQIDTENYGPRFTTSDITISSGLPGFLGRWNANASDHGNQTSDTTQGSVTETAFTDVGALDTTAYYHYTITVPDPATLALLVPGLAGLGFFRRRKHAS